MGLRIAVVHHPRSVFPLDLRNLVGDGVDLVWVADTSVPPSARRLLDRLGPVVDIAGLDLDEAAARVSDHQVDGIAVFIDDQLVVAAELAARLDLPFLSPSVARTVVDKRLQRASLERAGVPGPRYRPLRADAADDELDEALRWVGSPAVLKPAEGNGSRGIHLVADARELRARLAEDPGEPHLLEELMDDLPDAGWAASYLSVESVITPVGLAHVGLTGRFPLASPFRETGNFLPAAVSADTAGAVVDLAERAIRALGLCHAIVHTEIKLTSGGPKLIEVNGRLGGRPPHVLRRVSGINLFRAVCDVAAGVDPGLASFPSTDGVAFWLMLQPPVEAQAVLDVRGIDRVAGLPGVEAVRLGRNPGAPVDWREGTASAVATVEGWVPDHDALEAVVASIRSGVRIEYA